MCPLQRRIDSHPTPPQFGPNLHPSNISLPLPDFTSRPALAIVDALDRFDRCSSPPPPSIAARAHPAVRAVAISPDAAAASCPLVASRQLQRRGASSF
ncbi:uncharacterized protein TrAtP1_003932 [Trichoderma atroviride]|uniref:uncharacterized protein n=1 Tax=Hypocrea atroviridis TaxID=63577 RepID=UPI00331B51A0|nr:hypothetical protein TrAtP1_003932 [Trichoderma atroviride]